MNIKVIGSGCEKCTAVYKSVTEAVEELGLDAEIEKVEDLLEIVKLGVISSPSIIIDGKIVSAGRVLNKKQVIKLLKAQ